jgi:hypothetical protein
MAWKNVEPPPPTTFVKFSAKGHFVEGHFAGAVPSTGKYGGLDLTFEKAKGKGKRKGDDGKEVEGPFTADRVTVTIKGVTEAQYQDAVGQGLLPGMKTVLGIAAQKQTSHPNPQNVFALKFDPEDKAKTTAPIARAPRTNTPPPGEDPFEGDDGADAPF